MSKEYLEALKNIKSGIRSGIFYSLNDREKFINNDNFKILEEALKRLEAIDNANHSEALEILDQFINEMTRCLENPKEYIKGYERQIFWKYKNTLETTIKQVLLKSQKEHKALEIIKKKCLTNCNLALVKDNLHYQNYCKEFEYFLNKYNESPNGFEITEEDLLTEEEFELLRSVLE